MPKAKFSVATASTNAFIEASPYKALALWGHQLGSYAYYIEGEQRKAAKMNAPLDALFERDGKWVCMSDLSAEHSFRAAFRAAFPTP